MATPSCFRLLVHEAARAFSRAWAKTGKRIAARIAIIAITTSNSIRVKPGFDFPRARMSHLQTEATSKQVRVAPMEDGSSRDGGTPARQRERVGPPSGGVRT